MLVPETCQAKRSSSRVEPQRAATIVAAFALLPDDALVDEIAVAAFCDLPRKSIQRLRWEGDGPPYLKFGLRSVRYRAGDVRRWRASRSSSVYPHTAAAQDALTAPAPVEPDSQNDPARGAGAVLTAPRHADVPARQRSPR
jgi:predicted DNA-binding transcriptional regulator AlpA